MADFAKPISQLASRQVQIDPHPGQGIALDHLSLIPANALGSGTTATNVFLAGDRSWRTVAGGGGGGSYAIVASNTTFANTTVSISGFGAATINTAANLIRVSVPVQTAQTGISGLAASNTTYTSGTVTVTGVGGGVTVSSNTGQRIDISVAAQSAQTGISSIQASDTTYTSGQVIFTGSNVVTVKSGGPGQRVVIDARAIQNLVGFGTTASGSQVTLSGSNIITVTNDGVDNHVIFDAKAIQGIAASNTTYTTGTVSFTGVGGGVTVSSNTGQRVDISVASQSVQTQMISPVLDYFDNQGAGSGGLAGGELGSLAQTFNTLLVQPLTPFNEVFPGNMTASTVMLQFSHNHSQTSASSSHSSTVAIGIYTKNNATRLSLLNSVQTTWAQAAATNQTASYHGLRWITIHSSAWSASPTFSQGQYWVGMFIKSSNFSTSGSFVGQFMGGSAQRSGSIMSSVATNTQLMYYPFMGILSVSTTGIPGTIAHSDLNKATALAPFIPNYVFNNLTGSM